MKISLIWAIPLLISPTVVFSSPAPVAGEPNRDRVWHVSTQELSGIEKRLQVRTITEAAARVEPGDTVMIHGGVYREHVVVKQSGTASAPIRFVAAAGERVVVTGADVIDKWERVAPESSIYRTPWPHDFISWTRSHTHPADPYHVVIGRAEQVFVHGYWLHQVLQRDQMSRGSFYVDLKEKQLYVWGFSDEDFATPRFGMARPEASTRAAIWESKGAHIHVRGLGFRYCANRAQRGAATFAGDYGVIEDCVFEKNNSAGASFTGQHLTVRRCVFQENGQLGFGASGAHYLLFTNCVVRNNNTKGYDRDWEAGGNKLCQCRGVVLEHSSFIENRGLGIWFDISNVDCTVRNCLIADNEDAGIFYEISYGLHAHDNVIIGNGFGTPGPWGANGGISVSSSPHCVIERNLLFGNKEGFQFRENGTRSTPRIDGTRGDDAIWDHDELIKNNILAYNRDAQVWGWFDVDDQRHWPATEQTSARKPSERQPKDLALEKLNLRFRDNAYYDAPGHGFLNWGVTWKPCKRYANLAEVQRALPRLDEGGVRVEPQFADPAARDFRVPPGSPLATNGCYPKGTVPGVTLGVLSR